MIGILRFLDFGIFRFENIFEKSKNPKFKNPLFIF